MLLVGKNLFKIQGLSFFFKLFCIFSCMLLFFFSTAASAYDLSGQWEWQISNATNNCGEPAEGPFNGEASVDVKNDTIYLSASIIDSAINSPLSDSLSDGSINISVEYPDGGGTTEENISIPVNSDTNLSGQGNWIWRDNSSSYTCEGSYDLSLQKMDDDNFQEGEISGELGLVSLNKGYKLIVIGSSHIFKNEYFGSGDEAAFLLNGLSWMVKASSSDFSGGSLTGYKFLIDDYHDTDGDSLYGNLSEMRTTIEAEGGNIDALTSPITAEALNSYDAFIVYDYETSFSSEEISILNNWLDQGGELMVVGASLHAEDGGQSINQIINPLGVYFGKEVNENALNSFVDHPVTTNIDSLSVGGQFVTINGGTPLGSYSDDTNEKEQSYLYFPHIASNETWETNISVVNTGGKALSGTLKAYDGSGNKLTEKSLDLSVNGHKRLVVGEAFSKPEDIKYLALSTGDTNISGCIKFYQEGSYSVTVPAVQDISAGDIYVPHIASDANWWTGLGLVNTTNTTKTLAIEFNTGQRKEIQMAPGEHMSFPIASLFGDPFQTELKSAVIKGGSGIAGLELFGNEKQLGGVTLKDDARETLCFPHVASSNNVWTGIAAYNPSSSNAVLTVTPYKKDGTPLESITETISAGGKYLGNPGDLDLPESTAWLKMTSSRPVTGFELLGDTASNQLSGYSTVDIGQQEGVIPKLNDGEWPEIAIVNTANTSAEADLKVYDETGSMVASKSSMELQPHGKIVGTPENILGGAIEGGTYLKFSSDNDLACIQLNSRTSGSDGSDDVDIVSFYEEENLKNGINLWISSEECNNIVCEEKDPLAFSIGLETKNPSTNYGISKGVIFIAYPDYALSINSLSRSAFTNGQQTNEYYFEGNECSEQISSFITNQAMNYLGVSTFYSIFEIYSECIPTNTSPLNPAFTNEKLFDIKTIPINYYPSVHKTIFNISFAPISYENTGAELEINENLEFYVFIKASRYLKSNSEAYEASFTLPENIIDN